jgi:hypothetical protein
VHLSELGLRRVDAMGHRANLAWIAERPYAEVLRVVAAVLENPWTRSRLGRVSDPRYLRREWHRFADGPEEPGRLAIGECSPRESFTEPEPEWMRDDPK